MSIHFVSCRWEVSAVEDDGIMVTFNQRDLDPPTLSVLIDDLFELVQESGKTNFFLDFENVRLLPSVVFGKLIALETKVTQAGCRLILCNVNHHLYECFQAAGVTEILDIRE